MSVIEVSDFEGVVRIRMGRDVDGHVLYWVAAYLIDGLLIDTGCRHTAEELAGFLEGEKLKAVVNTHYHEDHVGANRVLRERFGVPIWASRESAPLINRVAGLYPYQEMVWGSPEPSHVACLPEAVETDRFRFDVVETPGHCVGHVALVERGRGWCFSGDLFVSRRPKVIRPEEDVVGMVTSMRRLIGLETDRLVLFTSIGDVVPDGREALRSCVDYLRDMAGRAKGLEKRGLSTDAIRDELFGGESSLAGATDGQFSSENLVRALLRAEV